MFCASGKFFGADGQLLEHAANEFISLCATFVRHLVVAVHVLSGMPARSPELGSLQWTNTEQAVRSVFFSQGKNHRSTAAVLTSSYTGTIMTRQSYHKASVLTGRDVDVLRYCCLVLV